MLGVVDFEFGLKKANKHMQRKLQKKKKKPEQQPRILKFEYAYILSNSSLKTSIAWLAYSVVCPRTVKLFF